MSMYGRRYITAVDLGGYVPLPELTVPPESTSPSIDWTTIIRDILGIIERSQQRQQQPQISPYPIPTPQPQPSGDKTLTYIAIGIGAAAIAGLIVYLVAKK